MGPRPLWGLSVGFTEGSMWGEVGGTGSARGGSRGPVPLVEAVGGRRSGEA